MSLIAAAKHQIGIAVDLAKNFILDASAQDGKLKLFRNSDLVNPIMSFDANNVMDVPANKIGFLATLGTSYAIPTSEIKLGTVNHNVPFNYGTWWNPATGQFKPNVAGLYLVTVHASLTGGGVVTYLSAVIKKNGAGVTQSACPPYSSVYGVLSASQIIYLNGTTDFVEFFAQQGGSTNGALNGSAISAALLFKV